MRTGAAVAAGGALGSLGRYGLGQLLPGIEDGWPVATFAVNVTGALLMGLLVATLEVWPVPGWVRPFAATGVLGGWTTYSAFALDLRTLVADGHGATALAYLVATLVVGTGACLGGLVLGERLLVPRDGEAA